MKKENFSQNMKDRMQQFEDGGLRLLKKGRRGSSTRFSAASGWCCC